MVLKNGKAKDCEVYPEFFCDAICNGVRLEMEDERWLNKIYEKMESTYMQGTINQIQESIENPPVPKEEQLDDIGWYKALYKDFEFVDDTTGMPLDRDLAVKARKLEIDFFRSMKVYSKVPRTKDMKVVST